MSLIECRALTRIYRRGENTITPLDALDLVFAWCGTDDMPQSLIRFIAVKNTSTVKLIGVQFPRRASRWTVQPPVAGIAPLCCNPVGPGRMTPAARGLR